MTTVIKLKCDKCEGESPLVHYGTAEEARKDEWRNGWICTVDKEGIKDLCPVCCYRNPGYWKAEPF